MKTCDHTFAPTSGIDLREVTELLEPKDTSLKRIYHCTKCNRKETRFKYIYSKVKPERNIDKSLLSSAHNHPDNPRKCIICRRYFPSELRIDCIKDEAKEECFCRVCYHKELKK